MAAPASTDRAIPNEALIVSPPLGQGPLPRLSERFTEHDLRAKCASDAGSLEHARALLAHADARTTERVYRRKPERVKPLR
jgi:integrase